MKDYADSLESGRTRREMIAGLRPLVAMTSHDFDTHTHLVLTPEGPVDTRTGELLPRGPEYSFRMQTKAHFDSALLDVPFAGDTILEDVVKTAFQHDGAMIDALQEFLGYCLEGDPREELFGIVVGPGGSAKGTVFGSAREALGDYGATSDHKTWLKDPKGTRGPREDLTRLRGKRLVCVSEVPKHSSFDEATLKAFSGRDEMAHRTVYGKHTEPYMASGTLVFYVNYLPEIDPEDTGLHRRLTVFPVPHAILKDQRRPEYKSHLQNPETGGKALLTWMIAGAIRHHRKGRLVMPEAVNRATAAAIESSDAVKAFVDERLVPSPEGKVSVAELWEAFREWQAEQPQRGRELPWVRESEFPPRLKALGYVQKRTKTMRYWNDVALRPSGDDGEMEADEIFSTTPSTPVLKGSRNPLDGEG